MFMMFNWLCYYKYAAFWKMYSATTWKKTEKSVGDTKTIHDLSPSTMVASNVILPIVNVFTKQ